ncbi:WD40-repeat-containing domain protein [Phellopilus nigrolimitatus]|nr:WD40-repeat-containing domain protein [Phellopilus nigrolimitatus]
MRSMVGDSVGNMSISPTSRDIVLAARKGLFIIDLESPLEVPRFLPQGGTWDVADVQWNPNPSHAEYIVSTSSERLLIWNLLISGKTSIEFILQSHYRAITDINWHTFDPDLVCSTGIDSWIWAWDIRDPQKPAFAGGTQVKWNRKDGNILASSHLNEVLIWDRRARSIPVSKVKAHDAKIYGIDWSHSRRNEIITCSLDKTIKIWNTNNLQSQKQEPSLTFHTDHPVWRARDLPFGRGVLSLPQRGETSLGMWSTDDHKAPVETFEGHTDVVKEFVWRSHGNSNASDKAFQLITWSKDKTLRFWPVGRDVMRKAGAPREASEKSHKPRQTEEWVSFRSPPLGTGNIPALSAPRGHRSILDGIRATLPTNPVLLPHHGSAARASRHELPKEKERERPSDNVQRPLAADRRDGTMSKGNTKGGRPRMGPAILSNFLAESVGSSRLGSESRPPSAEERSRGRGRTDDGPRDSENATSLLDEINSVVNKLTPAKIKLERHGLTKHRSCTFGLHGPWGESSVNVFVRVTFTFPRDYPHGKHPRGTPLVEIERSPLISVKMRAHMKKGLKDIRESQRPCLEACLRFLLFSDGGRRGQKPNIDSGTSDEDEPMDTNNSKDFSASLIRDHPNLAEPRSSQGVFGPNGQLVCIFRSLPRLVKAVPQDLSATPAISSQTDGVPRLFQSPLQLSKAVRRLAKAMNDHSYDFLDSRNPEGMENILGIMNNLLSFSHPKDYTTEPSRQPSDNAQSNYSLLPKRMTIVFIKDRSFVVGAHRKLATQYSLKSFDLLALCRRNSEIAHRHARFDHERLFNSLVALFRSQKVCSNQLRGHKTSHSRELIRMRLVVNMLHEELLASKDVQLLAMFAIVVLQIITSHNNQREPQKHLLISTEGTTRIYSSRTI